MPKFTVTGDIICGAFTHTIEAETEDDALEAVRQLPINELDSVSSEHEFAQPTNADVEDDGAE